MDSEDVTMSAEARASYAAASMLMDEGSPSKPRRRRLKDKLSSFRSRNNQSPVDESNGNGGPSSFTAITNPTDPDILALQAVRELDTISDSSALTNGAGAVGNPEVMSRQGSGGEAQRCCHHFLAPGTPSSSIGEQVRATGRVGQQPGINGVRIHLQRGENLIGADSSGLSDPFCRFKIGKFSKYKSEVCRKTLNPVWSDEFFMPCPKICLEPLVVEVFDWDRIGEDFIGGGEVDISNMEYGKQYEVRLELQDTKRRDLGNNLGVIVFSMTRERQLPQSKRGPRSKRNKTAKGGPENACSGRLVTVLVIEARDLIQADARKEPDPFVQLRIGKHRHKSKVVKKSTTPVWKQRFEFPLHDDSRILSLTVMDDRKMEVMGKCEVDISLLELEKADERWIRMGPEGRDGDLRVQVTVTDLFRESTVLSTSDFSSKFCGRLAINVHQARGLASADIGGKSDPFAVCEVGNTRLRTKTEFKTLTPQWEKTMVFPVKDIFQCVEITVFDEDKGGKSEFLGAVIIPILDIRNDVKEWYTLKKKSLLKRGEGEIQLSFNLQYHKLLAYKELVMRHEEKFVDTDEKFNFDKLKVNIERLKDAIVGVVNFFKYVDGLFKWDHGFLPSFIAMIVWIVACLKFELWMAPLVALAFLGYQYLTNRKTRLTRTNEFGDEVDEYDYSDDEDDDEDENEDEPKRNLRDKFLKLKEVAQSLQNHVGEIASHCERVVNLTNFTVPLITQLVCVVLAVVPIVLYYVPLSKLLLAWGIKKFSKKFLQKYQPFGLCKPPKGGRPPPVNEVLELLGRVPSCPEVEMRRKLAPLRKQQVRPMVTKA